MGCIVLHGAGEDVSGSQLGRDFLGCELRAAVPPDGRSGDYPEAGGRHASELGDHLLGKSPAQICLCRVSVQVVERQNGDERGVTRRAEGEPASGEQHPRTGEQGEEPQTRNGGLRHGYRRGRGCGGRRGGRFGRDGAFLDAHVREKPVPTSHDRLNETRLVGAVPQCQAHLPDGRVEALVEILEAAIAPEDGYDHVARQQLVAVFDE